MKRTLLLLCIVLLTCTLSFVAFAADDNTATSEYIITSPETLELDAAGTGDFTITLSDSLANGKITITITGTSYHDGYWHLTNAEDSKLALKYTLSSGMSMVYIDNASNSCTAYERNDASGTTEWKTSRIIDFGNTPQTVSLELAIWIAMNATKIA